MGHVLTFFQFTESLLLTAQDSASSFVYSALSSFDAFALSGVTVQSANTLASAGWSWHDAMSWLSCACIEYQLFFLYMLDTMYSGLAVIANSGVSSPFFGVGTQVNPLLLLDHLELIFGGLAVSSDLSRDYGTSFVPALADALRTTTFDTPFAGLLKAISYLTVAAFFALMLSTLNGLGVKSE